MHTYACIHICRYIHADTYMNIHSHTYMHIHPYAYIYIYIYPYTHMHIRPYAHMHIHPYTYICIHKHKNMVTRLLRTRVKSINLTWYLQCFVRIIIQGPEVQKDTKLVFHPEQRGGLVLLVMSVDVLVYLFPQVGINDFVVSVFQAMRHDFFSHIQDLSRTCCQPIWHDVCVCVQVQEERAVA